MLVTGRGQGALRSNKVRFTAARNCPTKNKLLLLAGREIYQIYFLSCIR